MIDSDCILCPICGASQEADLPQYGRGPGSQTFQTPSAGPVQPHATLQPQFGAPLYLSEKRKEKKEREPNEKLRKRILVGLIAGTAVALLVSIYFLILIITRNSFLSGGDQLREAVPAFTYTINGADSGEMKVESMKLISREGLYSFSASYDVTISDERMEHKLTLDIKGRNRVPFGWEVTEANWSERTQGKVTVKINGISGITQSLVEQAVPTHKVQNFAIWVDQGKDDSFKGNCVIANTNDANYSVMGSFGYEGRIAPSVMFGRGTYDYVLTIQRDTSETLDVSYGGNGRILKPVYVVKRDDGEIRFKLTKIAGQGLYYEAYRVYKNGKQPAHESNAAPLQWNVEREPKTENPIASERIGATTYLFDENLQIQVVIGPDHVDVICDGTRMEEHTDIPLKLEEWTGPATPEPKGETVDG